MNAVPLNAEPKRGTAGDVLQGRMVEDEPPRIKGLMVEFSHFIDCADFH